MKWLNFIGTALLTSVMSISSANAKLESVNPIIGDDGFKAIKGRLPNSYDSEKERVQFHLLYAEYLLRRRKHPDLTTDQKRKREKLLDALHEYALAGRFPANFDYRNERKPCFIDAENTICAVGYLVEKSEGLDMAEEINEKWKYAYIEEMDKVFLEKWAEENGLTLEECAIIQPSYEWRPQYSRKITFTVGSSFRPSDEILSRLDLMYFFRKKMHPYFSLSGLGVQFIPLRDQNYATALRYINSLYFRRNFILFAGVGAERFEIDNANGLNIVPEIGISYDKARYPIVFHAEIGYSYRFGSINPEVYTFGRNEIAGILGIGYAF